jgi:hypothetical protein
VAIKGTKTELNLLKAFAGESQARNRYWYFSGVAKKEGFEQISGLFLETAENDRHDGREPSRGGGGRARRMGQPLPVVRRDRREGGLRGRRQLLPGDRGRREGARGPLSQVDGQRAGAARVHQGLADPLEVPQLRLRARRRVSAGRVPGMQAPAVVLRSLGRVVLRDQTPA